MTSPSGRLRGTPDVGDGPGVTRGRRFAWSALAAVAVLVARAFTLKVPLGIDESDYMLRGLEWMQGARLYADLESTRPPLLYMIFGLIGSAARTLGLDPGMALRAGSALVIAATAALLVWYLSPRVKAVSIAGLAVSFAALFAAVTIEGFDANAEHWLVLPWTASVLLLLSGSGRVTDRSRTARIVAAGALLGVAVLIKQVAVLGVLVPLALVVLDAPRRRLWVRATGAFMAGLLAAGAAAVVWGAAVGELAPLLVFGSNFFYGSLPVTVDAAELALQRLAGFWSLLTVPLLVSFAAVAWMTRSAVARHHEAVPELLGLIAWVVAASAAVALPGRYYPHYFVLLFAPCAVCVSLGIEAATRERSARTLALAVMTSVVAFQVGTAALSYRVLPDVIGFRSAGPQVGEAIRRHGSEAARVFVWGGDSAPLVYSGHRPAYDVLWAYYPLDIYGRNAGTAPLGVRLTNPGEQLIDSLRRDPAPIVVLTRPISGESYVQGLDPTADEGEFARVLETLLKRDYRLAETAQTQLGPMRIWVRR